MKRWIFIDGKFRQTEEGELRSLSPGHVKGDGVFETIRAVGGRVFFEEAHLGRLEKGLRVLRIPAVYPRAVLRALLRETVRRNPCSDGRARLMVWQEGSRRRVVVAAQPYRPFAKRIYQSGVSAVIFRAGARAREMFRSVKSVRYRPFLDFYQRARKKGYDEAVLTGPAGKIVEGSRSNIFWVNNGRLTTPSLKTGCLPGIIRGWVLATARKKRTPVREGTCGSADLAFADEAFLTNSLIGIMPLTSLNGRGIGSGRPGSVTLKLMREYNRTVR
ncbi:MAG: aminotransferase class IV [Candidatus Omnitrophota bacterium]|nr:aminotransferase class IV [Candidatus Omnitrophota bacterium]MDZ4243355.1 aminotransferase class IV [Candidatus Omnitrophota bacterium]